MKKLNKMVSSVLLLVVLSGCFNTKGEEESDTNQETIEIVDAAEHNVEVPVNPMRVAVFDNAQIDNMDALGLGERIVATASSSLPSYLDAYSTIEVAGTLHEVDLEIAMSTEPDLAIVATRSASSYEALSEFIPTIDLSLTKNTPFESVAYNFSTLAKAFGKEDDANNILEELEQQKNELAKKASNSKLTALMLMYNEGSLSVFGTGSRFSHIHDDFGFVQVDENIDVSNHGMEISYEYILQQDPDVIFVLDRASAISGEETNSNLTSSFLENPLIEESTAFKNNQIIFLASDTWYLNNGGVQAYKQMMKDVEVVFE